jgi:hypothetical protein
MTLTIHIDGWPYRVSFTGRIDISRCWDSPDVAVRLASEDARVVVDLDWKALEFKKSTVRKIMERERDFRWSFETRMMELNQRMLGTWEEHQK